MLAESHPVIRRIIRFLALPYCFFHYINWKECRRTKIQVVYDLLYIFFKLKYYPDNYSNCRLWEKSKDEWVYYYGSVYDAWQRWRLRKEVFQFKYRLIFDDKNICYLLCKANNIAVPRHFGVVRNDNFNSKIIEIFNEYHVNALVVKPIEGRGGKGIFLVRKNENGISIIEKDRIEAFDSFNFSDVSVVQEYIDQHSRLSIISNSVNTVRIVTMLTKDDDVIFLGAKMRFGVGDAFLDNTSQGGIGVGINMEDGILEKTARDNKSRTYDEHPSSKIVFKGYKVPYWSEVLELAENVQRCFSYNKLLGQDIAISAEGPLVIELNAEYDNVMFEQTCGPLLKNKKVQQEFKNYDLLINKYQERL